MSDREFRTLRPIVGLLPGYAHNRRRGWTPDSVMPGFVTLPEYLLLRRVAIERDDGPIPLVDLRAYALDPYTLQDPFLDDLPRLIRLDLLSQPSRDAFSLTPLGIELLTRGERAANDYAVRRFRLAADDLRSLATTPQEIVTRQLLAPEPDEKAHQERVVRLRRFDQRETSPVQLEYAIYALQRARDDAHLSAWRREGLSGPELPVITHIWNETAGTLPVMEVTLRERLSARQVSDIAANLVNSRYVDDRLPELSLTAVGQDMRDRIERETDRVYFSPWPAIDVARVRQLLATVVAGLERDRS